MIRFKTIDWIVQVVLIINALLLVLLPLKQNKTDLMGWGYATVGGVQLISVCVHFFLPPSAKIVGRKVYHITLLVIIGFGIIAAIAPNVLVLYLFLLLFATPALAIFYTVVCYLETKKLNKSSL